MDEQNRIRQPTKSERAELDGKMLEDVEETVRRDVR